MSWKKLTPLKGRNNPCLSCPPIVPKLRMNRRIGVGFGRAGVTKDGALIWCEKSQMEWNQLWTVMKAENLARKDPNHDWQIVLDGPMHGETYQRHDRNLWVLVEKNEGFV